MSTLFITSFNPFIGRNILSTNVLGVLRAQNDLRIVIFVPDYKAEYFKTQFGGPNVTIEGVLSQKISRQDVLFRDLANSLADTSTIRFHRRRRLGAGGSVLRFLLSAFISRVLSRFAAAKRLARFADMRTISKTKFARFFEKYRPSLVFATDVYHDDDVHFLAEATQRGIKTVGMIRSWDNITNKGMFRMRPDALIAHNEVIKEEAVRYCAMPAGRIFVSGIPQFDSYVRTTPTPKEEFFRGLRLAANRPLILVAPHGKRFYDFDWQLLQFLNDAQTRGDLPPEIQWLVRFPPNDTVDLKGFALPPHFAVQTPGRECTPGRYNDREVTAEDTKTLRDALAWSSLVIHFGSTIAIDAAFCDVPNIFLLFDVVRVPEYLRSARRFEEYEHLRKCIALGGSRVVKSREELIAAIREYLARREYDREGRMRVVKAQCAYTDGASGRRIAQFVMAQCAEPRAQWNKEGHGEKK